MRSFAPTQLRYHPSPVALGRSGRGMFSTANPPTLPPHDRRSASGSGSAAEVRSWHLVREERESGTTSAIVVPSWGANVLAVALHHPELAWPIQLLESI